MKRTLIVIVTMVMTTTLWAQENRNIVEKGTVLTLGPVSASGFQHIDFPRKNFIIKRGGIANFNNLEGRSLVVEEVISKNSGTQVVLKRSDGLDFFGVYRTVKADLEKALAKGELRPARAKK